MRARLRPLPLFPLGTVLFPGGRLPMKIFEQRYLDLIKHCLAENTTFGLCGIREGQEVGEPAVPFAVGTEVRIVEWDMPQTGMFHIVVEGLERYVARSWAAEDSGLLIGEVDSVSRERACAVPDDLRLCAEVLRHATLSHLPPVSEGQYQDAVWVGYRLSEMLPFKLSIKQHLLEMNDSTMRLRLLDQFLRQQAR